MIPNIGLIFFLTVFDVSSSSVSCASHSSGSKSRHIWRSVLRSCSESGSSSCSNSCLMPANLSTNGPVVLMPAVVEMNVIGSLRGPIDDSTTDTSLPMSLAPLMYVALPYSSAEQSCAKRPSFVLPPAESAVSDAVRNCPGFQFTCEAVKRMRRSRGSI